MVLIETIEPRRGAWTGAREWGSRYQGPMPRPGFVQAITELSDLPGPPRPVSVHLTRENPDAAVSNLGCYARITYGAGANSNVLHVDWAQGATITVIASSVKVEAVGVQAYTGLGYGTPKTVVLGVSFGLGASGPAIAATYTTQLSEVTEPGVVYPEFSGKRVRRAVIPQFARRVIPYGPDIEKLFDPDLSELGAYGAAIQIRHMTYPASVFTVGAGLSEGVMLPGLAREVVYKTAGNSFEKVGFIFVLGV